MTAPSTHYADVRRAVADVYAARRKQCGMSMYRLGLCADCAPGTIYGLEDTGGTRSPSLRTLCRVAEAMGCEIAMHLIERRPACELIPTAVQPDVPGQLLLDDRSAWTS